MTKQILVILLIFICCIILLVPAAKKGYADSILGSGVNIQSDGRTGHGTITINSIVYQAPNLSIEMGKIVKISGYVFSGTEKSKIDMSGIKVKGTIYEFTGFLTGQQQNGRTNVQLDLYIVGANPIMTKQVLTTQKKIQISQIKLAVKSYDRVTVGYSYGFEVKAFDEKSNPTGNFDQKYGKVAGVNISVALKDKSGKILMNFNGITNNQGYYSDSKRVVNYLSSVAYSVIFNATKNGYISDSVIKTVFIQANPQ